MILGKSKEETLSWDIPKLIPQMDKVLDEKNRYEGDIINEILNPVVNSVIRVYFIIEDHIQLDTERRVHKTMITPF